MQTTADYSESYPPEEISSKAWKGLINGASEIFTTYGTYKLGDLYSIYDFDSQYFGEVGLVCQKNNLSILIPGYQDSIKNVSFDLSSDSIVFAVDNTPFSESFHKLHKANWN